MTRILTSQSLLIQGFVRTDGRQVVQLGRSQSLLIQGFVRTWIKAGSVLASVSQSLLIQGFVRTE